MCQINTTKKNEILAFCNENQHTIGRNKDKMREAFNGGRRENFN